MDTTVSPGGDISQKNKKYLQEMIDMFSRATGLNAAAVDLEGNTYLCSEEYERVDFCRYVKSCVPGGCGKCRETYEKACRESLRWNEPYFFVCHAGLVMWAVPVIINASPIGAMVCGQVLLWEPDELFFDELRQHHAALSDESFAPLEAAARKLKVISVDQCQSAANLLNVIVKYMAKSYDSVFMEQKSLLDWRNVILSRIEKQKAEHQQETFDYSVYFRRERRFLQILRMADKKKADKLLPLLFTDIEILSAHDIPTIRHRLEELMAVSSRALIEAGIETDTILRLVSEHREELQGYNRSDELFRCSYQIFDRLLDSAYLLIKSMEHTSVIKTVKKYINDHYSEKISMEDIAGSVSLSPSYLSALFKNKMNMTIHDYLIRVRIEKSIELMGRRELSIKEVMQMCGIESQSYYNRIFKKMIGLTPGKYRNQLL